MLNSIKINWCNNINELYNMVNFFISNINNIYISHGEVQDNRAIDFDHWNLNLSSVLEKEFSEYITSYNTGDKSKRIAKIEIENNMIGLLLIELYKNNENKFAILHDFIIQQNFRRKGIGHKILAWLEEQLRQEKIKRIFLESGIKNDPAHFFFSKAQYTVCSIIMTKKL